MIHQFTVTSPMQAAKALEAALDAKPQYWRHSAQPWLLLIKP